MNNSSNLTPEIIYSINMIQSSGRLFHYRTVDRIIGF